MSITEEKAIIQCSSCHKKFFVECFKVSRLGIRNKSCLECAARQSKRWNKQYYENYEQKKKIELDNIKQKIRVAHSNFENTDTNEMPDEIYNRIKYKFTKETNKLYRQEEVIVNKILRQKEASKEENK